mmetsp:Transcript_45156/g.133669  ORF Transcript_45156/g.133669 Transcript_45156/m.133669 type:complete len:1204 (-) Transcript_45156:96-3707(-)
MGLILAKRDEERLEFDQTRARASEYLKNCQPEYINNPQLLGLTPGLNDITLEDMEEEHVHIHHEGDEEEEEEDDRTDEQKKEDMMNDPAYRAKEKMKVDHLQLLSFAALGKKWKVMGIVTLPHVDPNFRDKYGRSAMYLAAERGHLQVVQSLVTAKMRIENENKDGWTPLHAATFHGQVNCMECLIQGKAEINARDAYFCTALTLAASSPKLYLMDLVSKKERQKRRSSRIEAYARQQEIMAEQKAQKKDSQDLLSTLRTLPPDKVWMHFPNRTELLVMEKLLAFPRILVDPLDKKKRTPLCYAARYGRVYAVSRLLYAKANTRLADKDGRTPLFHAASNEHWDTVELLLRAGASVNTTDQYFRTPLHGALENGDERMAGMLLKAEASVNAYDCEGRTPIMFAMEQKNRRLFGQIVQQRSNLDVLDKRGWNVVIYAIETGMFDEVMPLLQKLADRVKPILRARDPQGRNAMHHAAVLEDITLANKTARALVRLDQEASTIGDCNGDTAIHMAAEAGRLDTLRTLIGGMLSADFINNRGETPLHYAAHGGHLGCFVALIEDRGQGPACDSGAEDIGGRNVLMHACISGHLDLVNLLVSNRDGTHQDLAFTPLDVNHQDKMGITALQLAAREGHWHLLPSLVLGGANLAAKDNDGFSALHFAAIEDEALAVSCLLDLGVDPDVGDGKGWTALMHASVRGCDEAARVLVDGGADIDARNWDGDTALQLCCRRKDYAANITHDILKDAMLDLDHPAKNSIEANGHFMVSIINAEDLFVEGKVEELNTYCCIMLRTRAGAAPQVAFTSCARSNPSPSWHEVFRFDTEYLDPTACLVCWVIAAPGNTPEEMIQGTELGLTDAQIKKLKVQEMVTGKKIKRTKPQFTTAMQSAFNRLMKRGDRDEDKDILRMRKLALAQSKGLEPTMDLLAPKAKESYPLEERRWIEVENLRALVGRSGCDIQEPLVPRTHLPLGCVVVRFRHLRAAVWGTEIVTIGRTLRLNSRGNLTVEVDFRPKFFEAKQDVTINMAEEDEIYTLKPVNQEEEESTEVKGEASIADVKEPEKLPWRPKSTPVPYSIIPADVEPVAMAARFREIVHWSGKVIEAQIQHETDFGFGHGDPGSGKHGARVRLKYDPPPADANIVQRSVHRAQQVYKVQQQKRAARAAMLDKPMGYDASQEAGGMGVIPMRLPRLEAEPYLETLMESSRLL